MQIQDLTRLNRRQINRVLLAGAASLFTCQAFSQLDQKDTDRLESILDIPFIDVTVSKWKPQDVTEKLKARLSEKTLFRIPESSGFISGYLIEVSRNSEWWLEVFRQIEIKEYRVPLLVDSRRKRVYTLSDGDDKIVGFPDKKFTLTCPGISDNGTSIYSLVQHNPKKDRKKDYSDLSPFGPENDDLEAIIISDIQNSRKIVIRDKQEFRPVTVRLSQKGTRCIIPEKDKFHVIDLKTGKIINTISGSWLDESGSNECGMNYDASVVAFYRTMEYDRFDTEKKKSTVMWHQNLSRHDFIFSPNGNFCACVVEMFGPSGVDVYVHEPFNQLHLYNPSLRHERPLVLKNDGTLRTTYGVYKYIDKKYQWVPPNEKDLEGFQWQTPENKKPEGFKSVETK